MTSLLRAFTPILAYLYFLLYFYHFTGILFLFSKNMPAYNGRM